MCLVLLPALGFSFSVHSSSSSACSEKGAAPYRHGRRSKSRETPDIRAWDDAAGSKFAQRLKPQTHREGLRKSVSKSSTQWRSHRPGSCSGAARLFEVCRGDLRAGSRRWPDGPRSTGWARETHLQSRNSASTRRRERAAVKTTDRVAPAARAAARQNVLNIPMICRICRFAWWRRGGGRAFPRILSQQSVREAATPRASFRRWEGQENRGEVGPRLEMDSSHDQSGVAQRFRRPGRFRADEADPAPVDPPSSRRRVRSNGRPVHWPGRGEVIVADRDEGMAGRRHSKNIAAGEELNQPDDLFPGLDRTHRIGGSETVRAVRGAAAPDRRLP